MTSEQLAKRYNACIESAQTAALLHDIAKYLPNDLLKEKLELAKENEYLNYSPLVWHAPVGAIIAKETYHITDSDICEKLNTLPRSFLINDEAKYIKIFKNIASSFPEGNETDELFSTGWLLILISELIRDKSDMSEKISSAPQLQQNSLLSAKAFMNHNFKYDIKLKDIADSIHLSPNYFHKLFTSVTGTTPHDYLLTKRLNYAKELIMTSDHDMMEISMLSGFGSQAYFNYCFKKSTGLSPIKYREKEFEKYKV